MILFESKQARNIEHSLKFTQMDEVQVGRNQLKYLINQHLHNIKLQENQIIRIDRGTLASIGNQSKNSIFMTF